MAPRREGTLKRADPSTIQDKVLVGYQGWFTCAGDGKPIYPGHSGWLHWYHNLIADGGHPNIDLWPDTSECDPSELFLAPGLTDAFGEPLYLFSSRIPKTVQRHFHWMALNGVDGAFLQRFAGQVEIKPGSPGILNLRDEVGDRVREAVEAEGRVYAIMYDVSGVLPDKIQNILEQDWRHLLEDKHLLDSPNYLHEQGRPVVALWGFGFNGRNHTPDLVRAVAGFFRSFTPGGVYLVAGTPGHWRTSTSDADRNPEFVQVWTECFDAISPWTVGRYGNDNVNEWGQGQLKQDAEYLKQLASKGGRKVDYIPVVFPGGSAFNLSQGKMPLNNIRRDGGQFLWTQIYNAQCAGVRTIYGAMWDEYDEGTVLMPVVSHAYQLPVNPRFPFLALDADGYDLPSDWYMRIMGYTAEAFHGERTLLDMLPVKELQDYWSTRPHYETVLGQGCSTQVDVEGVTLAFGAWGVSEDNAHAFNDAPPPYSIEDTPAQQQPPSATQGPVYAPPVRHSTRPGSSSHTGTETLLATAAGVAAVGIAAHTISSSATATTTSSTGVSPSPTPPLVNMSSRPRPPPRPRTSELKIPRPEPAFALHPGSPPSSIPVGYDPMRRPTQDHPRVPSAGPGGGGGAYRPPPGPPPLMDIGKHGRGRRPGRSRSHSRSKSRSSSKGRRYGAMSPPIHHGHGHGHSVGFAPVPAHGHGHDHHHGHHGRHGHHGHGSHSHSHNQSLSPLGSPTGMTLPGTASGYSPLHSHPVGYGSGYPGPYPDPNQSQGGYGYAPGPVPGQGVGQWLGQGYGRGQGYESYDTVGQPQQSHQPGYGAGYTPSSSTGYYASYASNSGGVVGSYPASGGSGGRMQGGITSALNAVEGIAGAGTRRQLEKTVQSLTNSSLFNKFK